MRMMRPLAWFLVASLAGLAGGCAKPEVPARADPQRVEAKGLRNVYRVAEGLYSGSSPEGDDGFASLSGLGVKTVISVDGAQPDAARARRLGMRYVHVPIGYDGVPESAALVLARAVRDLPGPVYLHCHRGKHRGPAAAAVALRCLDGQFTADQAASWLRQAGTDPRYAGLVDAPGKARPLSAAELDRIPAAFPEAAPVAALAARMVDIDGRWERLELLRGAGWKAPPGHPDLDPAHEALLLREAYREAGRSPFHPRWPEELARWMKDAEDGAGELEAILRKGNGKPDRAAVETAFKKAESACSRCHAGSRDKPRGR